MDTTPNTSLPRNVQEALNLITNFGSSLKNLDEGSQQALSRILPRYEALLVKFNTLNTSPPEGSQEKDTRVALLKNIQLFEEVSEFDLLMISEKMEELQCAENTNILTQSQIPDGVYFIAEGKVEILVNQELVAHRGAGDSVGEMSCLLGEPASATVCTVDACKVFVIKREEFLRTIDRFPQLWRKLFGDFAGRFNKLNQRTSEILQHSPQGLIKIDKEGKITNEFSSQCIEYFQTNRLEGKDFGELLFRQNPSYLEGWQKVFPLIFEDVAMEFVEIAELLPQEASFFHDDGRERIFRLSYYPCQHQGQRLEALDVGVEDITEEREAENRNAELEHEKLILQKIYEDPESFLQTLNLMRDVLQDIEGLVHALIQGAEANRSPEILSERLKEVMRALHTLKGMGGMFLLQTLKKVAHQTEDYINLLRAHTRINSVDVERMQKQLALLKQEATYAHGFLDNMSEELRTRLTGIVISNHDFNQLKLLVEKKAFMNTLKLQKLLNQIEKLPIRHVVKSWPDEIARLSQSLGKNIKFVVEGENLYAPRNIVQGLDTALIHVMRNSVDHGMEMPEERLEKGKSEWGRITVTIEEDQNHLVFEIADDGRGLNYEKIVEKARSNEKLDQNQVEAYVENDEIWKLLFVPGFSTASQITDLSGRGVGLDAVQAAITKLGGTIRILSKSGEGTVFSFNVPLET